mmetsp:Transcript_11637/g.40756  ORF Transcript_11637/g.40756 Transcript_11637/m.40756 type:complete len:208 (+) Transcript_11637:1193-1816(+)
MVPVAERQVVHVRDPARLVASRAGEEVVGHRAKPAAHRAHHLARPTDGHGAAEGAVPVAVRRCKVHRDVEHLVFADAQRRRHAERLPVGDLQRQRARHFELVHEGRVEAAPLARHDGPSKVATRRRPRRRAVSRACSVRRRRRRGAVGCRWFGWRHHQLTQDARAGPACAQHVSRPRLDEDLALGIDGDTWQLVAGLVHPPQLDVGV